MNATNKLCQLKQLWRNCRNLHATHFVKNAYECPGKTTVTFISKEIGPRLLVTQCDQTGFLLNTGVRVIGPMILFPRLTICWNITSGYHINEKTLSLFTVLEPKPDLLIIGLDDKYDFTHIRNLQELSHKLNITTEIVSVQNACTAFNFVNEEGRYVVAALIPQRAPKQPFLLSQRISEEPMTASSNQITANNKPDNSEITK